MRCQAEPFPPHILTTPILMSATALKIQDVTHTNEAVECTAINKPTSLPDAWNRGDKIYNVGNQTDWTIFIKK